MSILKKLPLLLTITFIYCMKIEKYPKYKYNDNGRIIIPSQSIINNLPKDGGNLWNRLIFSKSPYLLQHSANPVDWYPWCDEAFKIAKKQNKPIFDYEFVTIKNSDKQK